MPDDTWQAIEQAPHGSDLELKVADHFGAYRLPFLCRRTARGWINAETGVPLAVKPVAFRLPQQPRPNTAGEDDRPMPSR